MSHIDQPSIVDTVEVLETIGFWGQRDHVLVP